MESSKPLSLARILIFTETSWEENPWNQICKGQWGASTLGVSHVLTWEMVFLYFMEGGESWLSPPWRRLHSPENITLFPSMQCQYELFLLHFFVSSADSPLWEKVDKKHLIKILGLNFLLPTIISALFQLKFCSSPRNPVVEANSQAMKIKWDLDANW